MRAEVGALVVVGLAILAAAGLDIGRAAVQASALQAPSVASVQERWGPVDERSTELRTLLRVHNPNDVALAVRAARYDLSADGLDLGTGQLAEPATLAPRATSDVEARTTVPTERLVQLLQQHLLRGEHSELRVRGTVVAEALGLQRAVPLDTRRAFDTQLLAGLAAGADTCTGRGTLCLTALRGAWVPDGNGTALQAQLTVRNGWPFPLPLGTVRLALQLAGVAVALGSSVAGVTLPAGGQVDVPLRLRLDPAALGQWWPRHVQACESSPVTLGIAVQPLGFLDVQAQDVPAGTFTTHLACEPPGPPA